ncbi:MAG: sulfate transporter family protein [Nitratireductor sp.]|nr:sulfate transporter family protein [Nitratireductor sp.]
MIIQSARLAAGQIFDPDFRSVLLKSLGLTILLLIVAWIGLEALVSTLLTPFLGPWPWVTTTVLWLLGAGLFIGLGFLIGPVTAAFAGIFLDDVALKVEAVNYPGDRPGTPLPMVQSMTMAVKFTLVVIAANLLALMLVLLPFVNVAIFFFVNAWLLAREYFQFAAMRLRPEAEADAMRKKYAPEIFIAGLVIAGFMAVPVLNLLTPLFATAMMVHVHKALAAREASASAGGRPVQGRT